MTTAHDDDRKRLDGWLSLIGGPGFQGGEARDRAVAEMRAVGADRLFPLLGRMLTDSDPEVRCLACEAVLWVDARRAFELVLPLLDDPDIVVRCQACGCLHDFGDERAVAPLVRLLQGDPEADLRTTAAYALGGIGSPAAIPALLAALESDHEFDCNGHSASSCAATALDDILGTNETRIRLSSGLSKMAGRPPDIETLKRTARELFDDWSKSQAEPGSASCELVPWIYRTQIDS
jgi:HEAT repeat protein